MEESKSRIEKSYVYDDTGRLVSVTYADGKQFVYRYDAAGNRISVSPLSADEKPVIDRVQPVIIVPPPSTTLPRAAQQITCPNCRALVDSGARFCPQCAAPLTVQPPPIQPPPVQTPSQTKRFCTKCGATRQGNKLFCTSCGNKFND